MGELLLALSLVLFFALVAAFLYVLRRAAGLGAATREDEGFRTASAGLTDRAATLMGETAQRIDRVRRRQDAPAALDEVLPATLEALAGLRAEVDAFVAPGSLAPLATRLGEELDRATRAVEVVQHGCALMGVTAGRPREMEGETSIKRGYLNFLHAREAISTLGVDLRAGHLDAARWFSSRPRAR